MFIGKENTHVETNRLEINRLMFATSVRRLQLVSS
ncbi:MAG: hypothetical protein JWR03_3096 [Cohnella sp.]|nr:hypothetical protein [Cohnella sp.]